MRDKNRFTYSIAVIGIGWLGLFAVSLFHIDNRWEIWVCSLLVTVIGLFQIKLQNRFYYSFDIVPAAYLAIKFGWMLAPIPSCISLILLQLRTNPGRTVHPFRFFISLGMYVLSLSAGQLWIRFTGSVVSLAEGFIYLMILDMVSLFIQRCLQSSVLGSPLFAKPSKHDVLHVAMSVLVSSILLARLLETETWMELLRESVLDAVLLYLLSLLSKQYIDQLNLTEELRIGYELCIEATDRILIRTDGEGRILALNAVAEKTFGCSQDTVVGMPIWEWTSSSGSGDIRETLRQAMNGLTMPITVCLSVSGKNALSVPVTLLPYTRNKAVIGVYFVGNAAVAIQEVVNAR